MADGGLPDENSAAGPPQIKKMYMTNSFDKQHASREVVLLGRTDFTPFA